MKRRLFLIATAGQGARALAAESKAEREAEGVRAAVRNYYSAFSAGDARKYSALVTDDYVLLEQGEVMTLQDDLGLIPKPGTAVRTDAIEFLAAKIVGDAGYAYWKLTSRIVNEKGTLDQQWLESGVLRRSHGVWKIAVLHSTRVERKQIRDNDVP